MKYFASASVKEELAELKLSLIFPFELKMIRKYFGNGFSRSELVSAE
jgi:hypothetical protein